MRKLALTVLMMIVWVLSAAAQQKSQTIVYINGTKYYIHTLAAGDTLPKLAKVYGVDENAILDHNPAFKGKALTPNENLKIPVKAEPRREKLSKKKLRKTFHTHVVAQGETLYAISRRYEIPIPTLLEDNPDLDPLHLGLNQQILVRKKQIGTETEQDAMADWGQYNEQVNSVTDDSTYYHLVKKGETFYSISRHFGITTEELSRMNDGMRPEELKAGSMIRIVGDREDRIDVDALRDKARQDSLKKLKNGVPAVDFHALRSDETLKVALMLPIQIEGESNSNYMEFYQGFLSGLDSVKLNHGYSVDVTLYNTGRDPEQIQQILDAPEFEGTQLIIGPVYESGIYPVVRYAEQHQIPVVSPLAQMTTNSDVLFQMAPIPATKCDKIKDLLSGDKSVTLIYGSKTDKEFEEEILAAMGDYPYKTYRFVFERGETNLAPLMQNKDNNVFVVLAESEVEVDRILASLSSSYANLTARSFQIEPLKILGNARWNRYKNLDRATWFKTNLTFVTTYHARRDNAEVIAFDKSFLRTYGMLPTLYSYRGYDAAMIFVPAMYNDIEYDMSSKRYAPLGSTYLFRQGEGCATHVNFNWTRVNYNSDFTITTD